MGLEGVLHRSRGRYGVWRSEELDEGVDEYAGLGARQLEPVLAVKVRALESLKDWLDLLLGVEMGLQVLVSGKDREQDGVAYRTCRGWI